MLHADATFTKMLLVELPSRMVRGNARGRGRGANANDHPPPPDYMAAMVQQFDLNRQFIDWYDGPYGESPQQPESGQPPVSEPSESARPDLTQRIHAPQPSYLP